LDESPGASGPYREIAAMYDELVGDAAFDCWRENFERITNRYSILFETACDVACGTGLAAVYLAQKCRRVYGVDVSPSMLAVASRRAGAGEVVFLEQSFADLDLPERVDLLTCNFDSLNYLTVEEELRAALVRFAASVVPGGCAIFDMNTYRELADGLGQAVLVHQTGAGFSIWESTWDEAACTSTLQMTNFMRRDDGLFEMSRETHREKSYDLGVITAAVIDAGFKRVEAFDARGLGAVGDDTRRVQFVALA